MTVVLQALICHCFVGNRSFSHSILEGLPPGLAWQAFRLVFLI